MKLCDFTFAFPALLSAIMLTATYGPGVVNAIIAIGIYNVPIFAKLTRATANGVLAREYVLAARAAGRGPLAIAFDHVLPNIAPALIVQATIQFAIAILAEAALSYLGLGAQPPQASWGRMLSDAQNVLYNAPLAGGLSRPRDRAQRARPQSARRRTARRARPEAEGARLKMLLEVADLAIDLATPGGAARVVNGVIVCARRRREPRRRRRIRLRQDDDRAGADGPAPEGARVSGAHPLRGRELVGLGEEAMRVLRGDRIAMIFQEPMTALNPLHRVGRAGRRAARSCIAA